jgi:AraC-like DNA-binding protein
MISPHRPRTCDPALRSLTTGCGASLTAIDSMRTPGYQAHVALLPGLVLVTATAGARHLTLPGERCATDDSSVATTTRVVALDAPSILWVRGSVDCVVANLPPSALGLPMAPTWDHIATDRHFPGRVDQTLYELIRAALAEAGNDHFNQAVPRFVIGAIVQHYIGSYLQGQGRAPKNGAPLAGWQLRATASTVCEAMDGTIRIDSLANVCGLTPGQFRRAFKHTTGTTPHRWLLQYRLERAREELQTTDKSVTEIALICGFADQSHLTRQFCAAYGAPPAQWRRNAAPVEA